GAHSLGVVRGGHHGDSAADYLADLAGMFLAAENAENAELSLTAETAEGSPAREYHVVQIKN
ncbi:MAG TPA: hypothetical protein VFO52_05290, partial [Longimicrobiales bacterium]|nr:hypothetical protein [Longimicrobiales bacterium]